MFFHSQLYPIRTRAPTMLPGPQLSEELRAAREALAAAEARATQGAAEREKAVRDELEVCSKAA